MGNHTEAKDTTIRPNTDPRYIPALTEKANFLVKLENCQSVLIYYDKALNIDPNNTEATSGKKQDLDMMKKS